LWGYELSELTALRKADSEQVKGFFSSTIDRFRGAYGRFVQAHPRQCVIFCSTNKTVYLYDLTGNRRFWPVWIAKPIALEWLAKWRDQLFAEAYAAYNAGAVIAPTREEEKLYFKDTSRDSCLTRRTRPLTATPGGSPLPRTTTQCAPSAGSHSAWTKASPTATVP